VLAAPAKTDRKAAKILELPATVENAISYRVRKKILTSKMRQSDSFTSWQEQIPAEYRRLKELFLKPNNRCFQLSSFQELHFFSWLTLCTTSWHPLERQKTSFAFTTEQRQVDFPGMRVQSKQNAPHSG
jgi:hypothetical protein